MQEKETVVQESQDGENFQSSETIKDTRNKQIANSRDMCGIYVPFSEHSCICCDNTDYDQRNSSDKLEVVILWVVL